MAPATGGDTPGVGIRAGVGAIDDMAEDGAKGGRIAAPNVVAAVDVGGTTGMCVAVAFGVGGRSLIAGAGWFLLTIDASLSGEHLSEMTRRGTGEVLPDFFLDSLDLVDEDAILVTEMDQTRRRRLYRADQKYNAMYNNQRL